jgi:hypothetical protein
MFLRGARKNGARPETVTFGCIKNRFFNSFHKHSLKIWKGNAFSFRRTFGFTIGFEFNSIRANSKSDSRKVLALFLKSSLN